MIRRTEKKTNTRKYIKKTYALVYRGRYYAMDKRHNIQRAGESKWKPTGIRNYNLIIIFIYCNWVVTRWQWLFYMHTKYENGFTKFKSGGLHEKHVVATWNVGNHLSICL